MAHYRNECVPAKRFQYWSAPNYQSPYLFYLKYQLRYMGVLRVRAPVVLRRAFPERYLRPEAAFYLLLEHL